MTQRWPRRAAYVKLRRASRSVVARLEPYFAARGLTLTQLGVLEAVLHKGPLSQRELGRKVRTSAGHLSDVVDKLAARRLVERRPAATDRRRVLVGLTPAGRAVIERVFPGHAGEITVTGEHRVEITARSDAEIVLVEVAA